MGLSESGCQCRGRQEGQGWDRSEQLGFASQGCLTRPAGSARCAQLAGFASRALFTRGCTTPTSKQELKGPTVRDRDIKAFTPEKGPPAHGGPSSAGQTLRGGYRCYCYISRAQDSEDGALANTSGRPVPALRLGAGPTSPSGLPASRALATLPAAAQARAAALPP